MGENVLDDQGEVIVGRGNAKWTKRNHTAAVKVSIEILSLSECAED